MNKLKCLLLLFCLILIPKLKADDVDVEVSPPEPLVNESFFVTFKVKSTGNVDPYISFSPSGATVQGKREQGVSISTTVINGKFTTTREQSYVYELIAEHPGQVAIRNIKVEVSGKTNNLKDLHFNVLAEARRIPDAFMEAQASKTKVYLGEAIDVNYYLYFKTSISANDVKEFPKLNKFIKRFHHINSPVETVQYKGQVLKRILAYSARLYPEKVGHAVLDPMTISVQIIESDYNSPFGGFGLGAQRYKNKDLSSPRIEVEVLPLPSENVPQGFTGLVGEHEFNLSVSKSKFLVNEPIEVKLEVKGKGALENMDAPVIYSDNSLEQFDTKSEVTELGAQAAKKVFDYTYLGRGPLNIKTRELSLSYFDPISAKYVERKISIPAIEVSGIAIASSNNQMTKPGDQKANSSEINASNDDFLSKLFNGSNNQNKKVEANPLGIVGPDFSLDSTWSHRWFDLVNIFLIVLIMLVLALWYRAYKNEDFSADDHAEIKNEIALLKKNGINYSGLYKIISLLDKNNSLLQSGVSITKVIEESQLSSDAKSYFKKLFQIFFFLV